MYTDADIEPLELSLLYNSLYRAYPIFNSESIG